MNFVNNYAKKGVAMAPVSAGTTASEGKRDYTHTYRGHILTAVRNLTKGMVARPVKRDKSIRVIAVGIRRYPGWAQIRRVA